MKTCIKCGKPFAGYAKHFQSRKKVGSYPLCAEHMAWAKAAEVLLQKPARDLLAKILPVKKGTIPRFKVGFKP